MRKLALIVIGLLIALPAFGTEFLSCWVVAEFNPVTLRYDNITRCRIAGGETVDYASDNAVPGRLYPTTGTDLSGQCWYYTSAVTPYVILAQYANGDADIGFDTDPANPGGIVAIGPTLPRCTSEPTPADDPLADVWDYVTQYIHAPPQPELSPPAGDGVTGLDTYVGVAIPDVHSATISSGLTGIDVYIEVSAVVVDWGDGTDDTYPPSSEILAGYPDGFAKHVYEKKTEAVPLSVSYDWTARWRIVGGTWEFLPVPNTTTTVDYPLAEIVSNLTD